MTKRVLICALVLLLFTPLSAALAEPVDVVNPGFEAGETADGLPMGWNYNAWEIGKYGCTAGLAAENAYEGSGCAEVSNQAYNDARLEQEIRLEPNAFYRFTVMAKAEGCEPTATGASLSVSGVLETSNEVHDTGGLWEELTFYGKTGPDQTLLTLMLRVGGYGSLNIGRAWFDNVQVEKLDAEPRGVIVANLTPAPVGKGDDGREEWYEQGEERPYTPLIMLIALLFAAAFASAYLRRGRERESLDASTAHRGEYKLMFLLGGALVLRVLLAVMIPGYGVDIGCWQGWAIRMAEVGPAQFYLEGFCDYPPGYMYVLWIIGGLRALFQLEYGSGVFLLLIKLPAIACDLVTALILYRIVRKAMGEAAAFTAALLFALNPAVFVNSAAWGQIDSILALGLVLCLDAVTRRKMLRASLIYAVTALIKPQAMIFAPLLLFAFIEEILESPRQGLLLLCKCALSALALMAAAIAPFSVWQSPMWIVRKYLSTMSSYEYASVNAFNLFAILGGNWMEQTHVPFLFSWQVWGIIGMTLSLAYATLLWALAPDKRKSLPIVGAVLVCGMFMLGVRMHERYMYPAFALLLLGYAYWKDKRLLLAFGILSVPHFVNVALALQSMHILEPDYPWMYLFGAVNLIGSTYLFYVAWTLLALKRSKDELDTESVPDVHDQAEPPFVLPTLEKPGGGERVCFKRPDWLWMLGITCVYAMIAFINLGDTQAPQTLFQSSSVNQVVTVDFGQETDVDRLFYYGGVTRTEATIRLSFSRDGTEWLPVPEITYHENTMFMWHRTDLHKQARYTRIVFPEAGIPIFEMGFQNADGETLAIYNIEQSAVAAGERVSDPTALFDEQELVPFRASALNSMYFDEIYHARTAYEHIHNIDWYETTHPPLGKVFISWAITLFGMTPFGWRFAGALAGVLMVPAMYFLSHLIFRRRFVTIAATLLLTFDIMHFSQTRLATIDSYPVLFIILMFAFMYLYMMRSIHREPLFATLWPLAAAGVCMGLGVASKWICIYAGIGLAVLFVWSVVSRTSEWMRIGKDKVAEAPPFALLYPKRLGATLGWCALFFVAVPVLIYVGSYYQYFRIPGSGHDLEGVWQAQLSMYDYHANLDATHDFSSPWWQWPLMIKPIFYYMGSYLPVTWVESINGMGNPLVWWPGFAALVWVAVRAAKGEGRRDPRLILVLVGFGAQFLPWVLVARCTFIYHYFASVPFIILCVGLFFETLLDAEPSCGRIMIIGYVAAAVAVFALFYPIVAAVPVPLAYAKILRWLPSWVLFGG